MSERLPTGLLVTALLRRVNDAGGLAVVRAKGDPQAGGVLVLVEEGDSARALERGVGPDGRPSIVESRPASDAATIDDYWRRRRARDRDLWVVELSIADSQRLIAETIGSN